VSVIVWDGKSLAADRQWTAGNLIRTTTKIWKHGDVLMGGSGTLTHVEALRNWVLGGMLPAKFPDLKCDQNYVPHFWLINRNGAVAKFEDTPYPMTLRDPFFAEGSGRDFAYGALEMGADAARAVEIACKYDTSCGGGIDVLTFDD
jgi:20S proteasome alpha/beta subunit